MKIITNRYEKDEDIAFLQKENLELRKKLRIIKMKFVRLTNIVKDIYTIIISFQKRLLHAQRLLKFAKLRKIDENIIKRIKFFFKEHIKVINDILKST